MADFATIEDIVNLKRPLTVEESERAGYLLSIVSDSLRYEADKVGRDLDDMIAKKPYLASVVKSVTVDVVMRELLTSTTNEPMTQESQSAGGYTWSGSYLVPGGGIFVKRSELARIGLRRQRIGVIELYEDSGNDDSAGSP